MSTQDTVVAAPPSQHTIPSLLPRNTLGRERPDAVAETRAGNRFPFLRTAALGAACLLVASCTALGGGDTTDSAPTGPVKLEQASLKVAVLSSAEVAPLKLAVDSGYFRDEGLSSVDIKELANGPAATAELIGGGVDVVYSSYVPLIAAQAKKTADLTIITDNSAAAEKTAALVFNKRSPVEKVQDLAGKKIAVPAKNTLADLMVKSAMADRGVDFSKVLWTPLSFDRVPAALEAGEVDAAMLVEPYIAVASRQGGEILLDLAAPSGPLDSFPFTAYAATKTFVRDKPLTVQAFQRGMARGAQRANDDRPALNAAVREYTRVDPDVPELMRVPRFGATLDARRIQRVADLMTRFGALPGHFDVAPMLQPPPPPRGK